MRVALLIATTFVIGCADVGQGVSVASAATAKPTTVYVSKLGDGSDGSSWAKAFHSIQLALNAVPNGRGKHRIIIRPDTYVEANLAPSHKGSLGAYNELVGDFDGSLGSGTRGWVVIDSE